MKQPKDFKVLLVYPNLTMMLVPSLCMAVFTGIFRKAGYQVELFDSTHHVTDLTSNPENRVKFLHYRPFGSDKVIGFEPKTDLVGDFVRKVEDFKPDLLVVSAVESTYLQAVALLEAVKDAKIPSIVGGVFVTAAPEKAISYPEVQMIGVGEGEETVLEVAETVRRGESCENIPNVWFKKPDGTVIKNPMRPLISYGGNLPDFSLFDDARFYRPLGGRVFKTVPIETYRGCPYQCTFCNSPMQVKIMRENHLGNYLRRNSIDGVRENIKHLIKHLDPEYLYFIDDSFLSRPQDEIFAFIEMYKEFKLPFWFNTRPENASKKVLSALKEVGADRISFGLECGNEEYRRNVVKRQPTNEQVIKNFDTIAEGGIAYTINSIIGFPDENRDMIFETIELNRQLRRFDSMTVSIFTPYHGTELRDLAVAKGYVQEDSMATHTTSSSMLRMPSITPEEIDGLIKTFALYVRFPKSEWPRIKLAESDTPEGAAALEEYKSHYQTRFFNGTQEEILDDWDDPTEYAVRPNSQAESQDSTNQEEPWGWNCGAEQREYAVPPTESVD